MSETAAAPVAATPAKKAKAPKKAGGAAKKVSSHPPFANMISAAVKALADRKGSSVPAIKKYINANYKGVGANMSAPMRRGMKAAIASGKVVQVKGKGLSGSFKAGAKKEKVKKPKAKKVKKPKAKKVKKPKAAGAKKAKSPKKEGSPKEEDRRRSSTSR